MDALERAIKAAGSPAKLATAIGFRPNVVGNWRLRKQIPAEQCPAVERATGVRCEEMRPDVIWTRDTSGRITGYHVPLPEPQADAGVSRAA